MGLKKPAVETIKLVLIASILAGFFIGSIFVRRTGIFYGLDFSYYYTGARAVMESGRQNLYRNDFQLGLTAKIKSELQTNYGFYPFINTPFLALLFYPFAFIKPGSLFFSLFFINMSFLLVCASKFREIFHLKKYTTILLIMLLYIPVIETFIEGQITLFLLLLFLLSYYFIDRKKDHFSGIASALMFSLKPQYIFLLPFLILSCKNKKRFLISFFLSTFLLLIIWFTFFGVNSLYNFFNFTAGQNGGLLWQPTFSSVLASFIPTIAGNSKLIYVIDLISFLGLFLLMFGKKIKSKNLILSLGIILMLVFAPHLWEYDYIFLLFPFFYLLNSLKSFKKRSSRIIIYAVLGFIWSIFVWRFVAFPFVSAFVLIVLYLVILKLKTLEEDALR